MLKQTPGKTRQAVTLTTSIQHYTENYWQNN